MKVRMTATTQGSTDGIHLSEYKQGETYELPLRLAGIFLSAELAVQIIEEPKPAPAPKPAAKRKRKRAGPSESK